MNALETQISSNRLYYLDRVSNDLLLDLGEFLSEKDNLSNAIEPLQKPAIEELPWPFGQRQTAYPRH
jgi:hypothetical protein